MNNETAITLASNTYDELGRLITKQRQNNTDMEQQEYNIRNWTTKLKIGTFEEDLFYNTNPLSANLCYNGNISYSNLDVLSSKQRICLYARWT